MSLSNLSLPDASLAEAKPWWRSKTIWGAIITLLALIAQASGYTLTAEDQAGLQDAILSVTGGIGAALAIWGRTTARTKVRKTGGTISPTLALVAFLAAAPLLGACSSTSTLTTVYTLDNTYYAALSVWRAYDTSTLDADTVADIEDANVAALEALTAVNKAVCPQAYTDPVGDACEAKDDAAVTAALGTAKAAVRGFDAILANHGIGG